MPHFLTIAPTRQGLRKILTLTLAGVLGLNGLIFAQDWDGARTIPRELATPLLPPSWAIGSIWTLLMLGFAWSYWSLTRHPQQRTERRLLAFLMLECWLYPVYTLQFSSEYAKLMGNLGTILLAAYLAGRVAYHTPRAAWILILCALWVSFATFASYAT